MRERLLRKRLEVLARIAEIWLPIKIRYDEVPSISVAIFHKGTPVYEGAVGYADVSKKVKATPDTRYRVASMSKMFTAVAILQLQEQRKLSINDKVSKYLPAFKEKALEGLTIKNFLMHTSGLIRDAGSYWDDDDFPHSIPKTKHQMILKKGTQFKYSNYTFGLLGEVIEKVSGMPYEDYVRKFIIRPAGLKNTYPDLVPEAKKHLATGYSRYMPGERRTHFKHCKTNAYISATGFISTTGDISRFLSNVFGFSTSKSCLSARSRDLLLKTHIKVDGGSSMYSLGFRVNKINGVKVFGHGGGFAGFITQSVIDFKTGTSVVVLTNTLGSPSPGIAFAFLGFLNLLGKKPAGSKKLKKGPQYRGIYRGRWSDLAIVDAIDRLLVFNPSSTRPDEHVSQLVSNRGNIFLVKTDSGSGVPGELATFKNIRGKIQKLLLNGSTYRRL
jgi:CubicO group peptidase (beta-lactamase class C family)